MINLDDFDFDECYQKVGIIIEALDMECCKENGEAHVVVGMTLGLDAEIEKCLKKQYNEPYNVIVKSARDVRVILVDMHELGKT